ncbi:hypothetical protein SD70_01535 [Gordoniibacillus kamchatkensis]|uniref:FAD:protein FMN transferase n=1 Tax=Gordoniibacillus kamchatkensis TaxID=1590651 RepID=A0ABR5AN00_9BACL|nr:FAD:protein FMN transferase [Paenibacillus sp. VKM B-2647]KIL42248.1 hypothetical protein SD70_01535 [Paenibacillus sp. VKM B-2647]
MTLRDSAPLPERALHSRSFRAMNTSIEVIFEAGEDEAAGTANWAADWFRRTEERFSRFLPESELSRLNRLAGERCLVSDAMLEVLLLADAYRTATGGIFSPFLLARLEQLGYGESFDRIRGRETFQCEQLTPAAEGQLELDIQPFMKSVVLPAGAKLDLGGIVKSWSVRRLAGYMRTRLGISRGLINAGGDLTVWGGADTRRRPWLIGIEHPLEPQQDCGALALADGAAATSSTLGRAWPTDRGPMHHLLDPRTGMPSRSGIVQCTVSGPDAVACEIWAKTLCISGAQEGLALMKQQTGPGNPYEALLFAGDGRIIFAGKPSSLESRWLGVPVTSIESW